MPEHHRRVKTVVFHIGLQVGGHCLVSEFPGPETVAMVALVYQVDLQPFICIAGTQGFPVIEHSQESVQDEEGFSLAQDS
jgi:hypothetical protein